MVDLREQSCWLLLVFESKLSIRIINDILVLWCKQLGRTLQEFFEADADVWSAICHLSPVIIAKLEQAKAKLVGQAFLAEQLQNDHISMMTVLDAEYPALLKAALGRNQIPPVLFYSGNLDILKRQTIALIGSRNASENSLAFTRSVSCYLAGHEANVISGNARGVDRAAYEGATATDGCTTVVLPHGIRKLSQKQSRELQVKIAAGNLLLLSQFHPDAPWLVSRAMERNNVVTGLAQVVIVAESDTKGGTWEGANGALKQKRTLYVCQSASSETLGGNKLLVERGGHPLHWPTAKLDDELLPVLQKSVLVQKQQQKTLASPDLGQLSLLSIACE